MSGAGKRWSLDWPKAGGTNNGASLMFGVLARSHLAIMNLLVTNLSYKEQNLAAMLVN